MSTLYLKATHFIFESYLSDSMKDIQKHGINTGDLNI